MAILLAAGAAGAGTTAYFSDTVNSNTNNFSSGTLTVDISNDNSTWQDTTVTTTWQSPSGWAPGQTFVSTVYLNNTGSVDATYVGTDWHTPGNNASWTSDQLALADKIQVVGMEEYIKGYPGPYGPSGSDANGGWYNDLANWMSVDTNGDAKLSLTELVKAYILGTNEGVAPISPGVCPTRVPGGQPMKEDEFGKCVRVTTDNVVGGGYAPDNYAGPALPAGAGHALRMAFKLMETADNTLQGKSLQLDMTFTAVQDASQFP